MFFDVTIIGAGVVGLSIAKFCSEQGYSVVVLEQESRAGERNSGVQPCWSVSGNELLYANLKRINHKRIGICNRSHKMT